MWPPCTVRTCGHHAPSGRVATMHRQDMWPPSTVRTFGHHAPSERNAAAVEQDPIMRTPKLIEGKSSHNYVLAVKQTEAPQLLCRFYFSAPKGLECPIPSSKDFPTGSLCFQYAITSGTPGNPPPLQNSLNRHRKSQPDQRRMPLTKTLQSSRSAKWSRGANDHAAPLRS